MSRAPEQPERVPERDRPAVDVERSSSMPELADAGEHLGGERLVDLDQVDVAELEAGPSRARAIAGTGPMPM